MKTCFVVCPIGDKGSPTRKRSDDVLDYIIKPACKGIYEVERSDLIFKNDNIGETLISKLYDSDIVIADLTDLNPNVFYEIGYRHALKLPLIPIAQHGTKIPFDIAYLRTVFYDLSQSDYTTVINTLKKTIDNIEVLPPNMIPLGRDLYMEIES